MKKLVQEFHSLERGTLSDEQVQNLVHKTRDRLNSLLRVHNVEMNDIASNNLADVLHNDSGATLQIQQTVNTIPALQKAVTGISQHTKNNDKYKNAHQAIELEIAAQMTDHKRATQPAGSPPENPSDTNATPDSTANSNEGEDSTTTSNTEAESNAASKSSSKASPKSAKKTNNTGDTFFTLGSKGLNAVGNTLYTVGRVAPWGWGHFKNFAVGLYKTFNLFDKEFWIKTGMGGGKGGGHGGHDEGHH